VGGEVRIATVNRLQPALLRLQVDLRHLGLRWAVVGGLAVSLRGEPRTTHDLDINVVVAGDDQAEGVVRGFMSRGYRFQWASEHEDLGRLMIVRLMVGVSEAPGVDIDLMFASSGIEEEVVAAAETLEILPGVVAPVATTAHLLALKTLAGRTKDVTDFATLVQHATERDLLDAREALELITRRGYDRGKDLQAEFAKLLDRAPNEI
jgi:Nucleotidyl transferase AbiEii toxin, Type IV TA system